MGKQDEREILSFYAGKVRERPVQPVSDDRGAGLSGDFFFWTQCFLSVCACGDYLFLFQDVFKKNLCEKRGEPVVSENGRQGEGLLRRREEGIIPAPELSYL